MIELIIWGIMIYLIILAIVYIVIPLGAIFCGVSIAAGAVIALVCYIKGVVRNFNPYKSYVDRSKNKEEFAARRSYFFGPGYHQLKSTVAHAWRGMRAAMEWILDVREDIADLVDIAFVSIAVWIVSWVVAIVGLLSIGLFGGILTCVLSIAHATIMIAVMLVIYVLFTVTWIIDRVYLQRNSVKTSCPYDQARSVIPVFECPNCGNKHRRLVPGPYGIWHRRCTCGEILPTTFMLGRSRLNAYCQKCGHALAASDVQQFSITVVGGTSSGKTVLLSSFFHEYFDYMDAHKKAYYEIPDIHIDMFNDMEKWFNGRECRATRMKDTSDMYSVILRSSEMAFDKQFSIYDIAGEAFDDPSMSSMLPQKQMKDSNGLVIVIDPLSAMMMRRDAENEGDDTSNYSSAEAATIITNFVTYLKSVLTHGNIKTRSDKPVAVVITKSDLSSICSRISYHKIRYIIAHNPGMFTSFSHARDEVCKAFLYDIGLQTAVGAIEANFSEVHYFPVSSMGHPANGERYEPEHVLEPFCWLINKADPELGRILGFGNIA